VRSIVQLHGPGIADNGDPGIRSSRWSGPGNDHNACPYRPCGRFGSPLGGRRLYDGDCPVSDPEEIAPIENRDRSIFQISSKPSEKPRK